MTQAVAIKISAELQVVAPPARRLSRAALDIIELALEHEDLGDMDRARSLLRLVEEQLQVTEWHRVEALTPGGVAGPFVPIAGSLDRRERLALSKARRVTKAAEIARAVRLNAPLKAPELPPSLALMLSEVERQNRIVAAATAVITNENASKSAKQSNRETRERAFRQIRILQRRVHDLRERQLDQHWSEHAIAETETLAKARKEEVEDEQTEVADWLRDDHGVLIRDKKGMPKLQVQAAKTKRLHSRGGFNLAYIRGDLDGGAIRAEILFNRGKQYRIAFERAGGLTTPDPNAPASNKPKLEGRQLGVAMAIQTLRTMRLGMTRKQRRMVDLVCGADMTAAAAAGMINSGLQSAKRALRDGLSLAAENMMEV